jgi:hypothetical protein
MDNVDSGMPLLGIVVLMAVVSVVAILLMRWFFPRKESRKAITFDVLFAAAVGAVAGVIYWMAGTSLWSAVIITLIFWAFHPWISRLFPWNWRGTKK